MCVAARLATLLFGLRGAVYVNRLRWPELARALKERSVYRTQRGMFLVNSKKISEGFILRKVSDKETTQHRIQGCSTREVGATVEQARSPRCLLSLGDAPGSSCGRKYKPLRSSFRHWKDASTA